MKKRLKDLVSIDSKTVINAQKAHLLDDIKQNSVNGKAIIFKRDSNDGIEYTDNVYEIRQDCIVLTALFNSEVSLKYVYYYLLANKDLWQRLYTGTYRRFTLSMIDLGMIEIDYPSSGIQEKIINCLDGVIRATEKKGKMLKVLSNFLPSYYQSLKNSYGRYWGEAIKVKDLIKGKKKLENNHNSKDATTIVPTTTGFEIYGKRSWTFTVDDTKCNPYFLSVALNTTDLLLSSDTFSSYSHGRFVSTMEEISLRLPDKKVQDDFELRYKQLDGLKKTMENSIVKLNQLFEILLYTFLLRGQETNDLRISLLPDNPLITGKKKYTYEDQTEITSLKQYDDKRTSLYDYLEKGYINQYFDSETGEIKFCGRKTAHV